MALSRSSRVDGVPAGLVPRRYPSVKAAQLARLRLAERLAPLLESVLSQRDPAVALANDPLSFVHRYRRDDDREMVGLLASSLAYGNVKVIRASIARALAVLGSSPSREVAGMGKALPRELQGFVHRFTRGDDLAALLHGAAVLQQRHGSLGSLFASCLEQARGEMRRAVSLFVSNLRAVDSRPVLGRREPPPGLAYLLPDGSGPGACKRLHMFLRWMVRGPDGVDLGLWKDVSAASLLMPLDTHTGRISRYLGLTSHRNVSWRTAEEVTWHLAGVDPDDPVRFDFALAHLGISKACTHTGGSEACAGCPLASACALGRGCGKRAAR